MRSLRLRFAVLVSSFTQIGIVQTAAAEVASQLDYFREAAGTRCPDEMELRRAIAARLGYDAFINWSPRRILVEVGESSDHHLLGTIRLVEGSGIVKSRSQLIAPRTDCIELVESIALTIALALDPEAVARRQSSPTPSLANPVAPDTEEDSLPTGSSIAAPRSLPLRLHRSRFEVAAKRSTEPNLECNLGAASEYGFEPHASILLHGGVMVQAGAFVGGLEIFGDLPQRDSYSGGSIRTHVFGGNILNGLRYGILSLHASLRVAAFWARGVDVTNPMERRLLHLAAGAQLQMGIPITTTWKILVDSNLHRNLTPLTFRLAGLPTWESPNFSYGLGVGVGWRFP